MLISIVAIFAVLAVSNLGVSSNPVLPPEVLDSGESELEIPLERCGSYGCGWNKKLDKYFTQILSILKKISKKSFVNNLNITVNVPGLQPPQPTPTPIPTTTTEIGTETTTFRVGPTEMERYVSCCGE